MSILSMNDELQTYLSLPYPDIVSVINDPQRVLVGLGKSTKRGIKKCFNCGTYNGTRRTTCKGKECGVTLRDSEEKSKSNLDAVKLLTGTERQVYSVRVRDMGPDHRGFVQLPLLHSHKDGESNLFSEVALCFVDSCQNSFDNSILKCHEEYQNENNLLCVHIKSALKSQSTAAPLQFKNDILRCLKVTQEVREKLFSLATYNESPLVQKVSKSVMAVKCQVSPKHPLGYLHFTFSKNKGKDIYEKYYCSCIEFLVSGSEKDKARDKANLKYKCIHYYACIWGLASDSKYWEDYTHFIDYELPATQNVVPSTPPITSVSNWIPRQCSPKSITEITKRNKDLKSSIKEQKKIRKRSLRKSYSQQKCKKLMPKILPVEIKVLNNLQNNEEVSWSFIDWLSYVTESINNTMQFANCGIINSLVFCVPEAFYTHFKKRIPDIYQETQTDFSLTHTIMNILHLKEIFDTPQIKLKISKKFVHNEQKGYVEYDENEEYGEGYNFPFIYFLNVGQSTVDESDNTNNSFIIEWTPTFTALNKIGQLKLLYKYGRKGT